MKTKLLSFVHKIKLLNILEECFLTFKIIFLNKTIIIKKIPQLKSDASMGCSKVS